MNWTGFTAAADDYRIGAKPATEKELARKQIDLTAMVDVTFLLLIFFMVTASFVTSSVLQHPPMSDVAGPINTPLDQSIMIDISQYNEYLITLPTGEAIETPSEREFRSVLRNAKLEYQVERVVIRAHTDSFHSTVVRAMDQAQTIGFTKIELTTTTETL